MNDDRPCKRIKIHSPPEFFRNPRKRKAEDNSVETKEEKSICLPVTTTNQQSEKVLFNRQEVEDIIAKKCEELLVSLRYSLFSPTRTKSDFVPSYIS